MQHFFEKKGDSETAAKFKLNSMEYVCTLGGDPLCLVTELPLFMLHARLPEHRPGYPAAYLKFLERKPELILKVSKGVSIEKELVEFDIRPLPLQTAVYIQLNTIAYALELLN